jgi:hypothetical protein
VLRSYCVKWQRSFETARSRVPAWALSWIPEDPDEMKSAVAEWLREHATQLRSIGRGIWLTLVHVLIGMIIGGMVAVSREVRPFDHGVLVQAMTDRVRFLGSAFRSVVFAQVRISALNTALTAVYSARYCTMDRRWTSTYKNYDSRDIYRRPLTSSGKSYIQCGDRGS